MSGDFDSPRSSRRSWLFSTSLGACALALPLLNACDKAQQAKKPLRIFAASSLTDLLGDLARLIKNSPSKTEVQLSFSGSHTLRHQLEQGARADLFISAHLDHLTRLKKLGLVHSIQPFADNRLALIVPRDNPAGLKQLSDLHQAKRLILADQNVPLGLYSAELLSKLNPSELHIASRENNARLVRAKVELGEADAAIVYASDAQGSSKVQSIALPAELNPQVRYFLGVCTESKRNTAVAALLTTLKSPAARQLLVRHGFQEPSA